MAITSSDHRERCENPYSECLTTIDIIDIYYYQKLHRKRKANWRERKCCCLTQKNQMRDQTSFKACSLYRLNLF